MCFTCLDLVFFFFFGSISSHSYRIVSVLTNLNLVYFAKRAGSNLLHVEIGILPYKVNITKAVA